MTDFHTPVLLTEVLRVLDIKPGCRYIDATLGGGGYTKAIIEKGGMVLGIDVDQDAVSWVRTHLTRELLKNCILVHGSYAQMDRIAAENGFTPVSGIVFDLGISSHQIDDATRGFSYRFSQAPLDLRFDQTSGLTAADILNQVTREELYEILAGYSEEKHSRAIADALCGARTVAPFRTTGEVKSILSQIIPERELIPTMSRVFQALRITVNRELDTLKTGLANAIRLVAPNGVLAVVTFHSLEDRIVKLKLRQTGWLRITPKPISATEDEIRYNPRSRSAKLRAVKNV
jgi:16S rRNA (cytosine1402-N4)-methyltransferase